MPVLRSVDLETTDNKEVLEVGWTDFNLFEDFAYDMDRPKAQLFLTRDPIGPGSMGVHHITEDMMITQTEIFDAYKFCNEYGKDYIHIAHYAEHELEYLPELKGRMLCTYKIIRTLWPELEHYGLQYLKYYMGLHANVFCKRDLMLPAHRAGPDSYVASWLFGYCVEEFHRKHPDVSVDGMIREFLVWTTEPLIQLRIGFGEHKGKLWTEVPDSYLQWILFPRRPHTKPFDPDVIHTAKQIKLSRRVST